MLVAVGHFDDRIDFREPSSPFPKMLALLAVTESLEQEGQLVRGLAMIRIASNRLQVAPQGASGLLRVGRPSDRTRPRCRDDPTQRSGNARRHASIAWIFPRPTEAFPAGRASPWAGWLATTWRSKSSAKRSCFSRIAALAKPVWGTGLSGTASRHFRNTAAVVSFTIASGRPTQIRCSTGQSSRFKARRINGRASQARPSIDSR